MFQIKKIIETFFSFPCEEEGDGSVCTNINFSIGGAVFRGFCGALVFSLPILVLWSLLTLLTLKTLASLGLLVGYAAIHGYGYFRGASSWKAPLIIFCSFFVSLGIGLIFAFALLMGREGMNFEEVGRQLCFSSEIHHLFLQRWLSAIGLATVVLLVTFLGSKVLSIGKT